MYIKSPSTHSYVVSPRSAAVALRRHRHHPLRQRQHIQIDPLRQRQHIHVDPLPLRVASFLRRESLFLRREPLAKPVNLDEGRYLGDAGARHMAVFFLFPLIHGSRERGLIEGGRRGGGRGGWGGDGGDLRGGRGGDGGDLGL